LVRSFVDGGEDHQLALIFQLLNGASLSPHKRQIFIAALEKTIARLMSIA